MYVTKSRLENGVFSWDSECPFTVDILKYNFRISVIENDFLILVNQPIYRYQKFELQIYLKIILIYRYWKNHFVYWHQKLLISVIQLDFPISVNQLIYRYRKFEFFISVNRIYDTVNHFPKNSWLTDIGKSKLHTNIGKLFTNIGNSILQFQ